jgi:hypothetical protein
MPGLAPGIHHHSEKLSEDRWVARFKPGNDGIFFFNKLRNQGALK